MYKYLFIILTVTFFTITSVFGQCGSGDSNYESEKRDYLAKQRAYFKALEKYQKKQKKKLKQLALAKKRAAQKYNDDQADSSGGSENESKNDDEEEATRKKSRKTRKPSESFFNTRPLRR